MASKAVATIDKSYPALTGDLEELKSAIEANIGDDPLSEFDIDRVKVPTGGETIWKIPTLEGQEYREEIEGIIIAWFNRRAYWATAFGGGSEPPDCASPDAKTGYGNPGGPCAVCPLSQFGSSTKEESPNAQACTQTRQLFVLTPGSMLPTVITVPPTSLREVRSFMFRLTKANTQHTGVVVKFTLKSDKSNSGIEYAKVTMNLVESLPDDAHARVKEYAEALMPSFQRFSVSRSDVESDGVGRDEDDWLNSDPAADPVAPPAN